VTLSCPKCQFENPEDTKYCGNCATPLPLSDETLEAQTETLVVPIVDLRTGSILAGRYEIIEELGKGGMGKVYKALDRDINEKIAVKIIRPEISTNKDIIQRFQNELKMARTITHRNVCRMHDLGKDGDTRFITMEYVSGEDLKKSIRRMGPLTVRKAISIGKQICHGLSEAHRLGVYHRDLKPHNIMIDREGNAKIMDFGIALSQKAKGITDSNVIIGTPQYLSPEQVEGKKIDQRSDIYSLGVILFEMVTGQVPFDGDTTLSIAVKHKTEIPRDPKELNAQIPEELSQLILKCMEKAPEERYQTADELCSELTQIEDEFSTTETAISRKESKIKPLGLSLKLIRFPRILLLFVLVLIVGYLFYSQIFKKQTLDTSASVARKSEISIIVLPLRDLSANVDQEPLHILMMENLIMNLHAFRELRVLPSTTSLSYQDSKKDIQSIGQEIKVSNVLEGSLWRTSGNLHVTIQLSSVESGSLIWTQSFEKPLEDNVELQEEITKAVAKSLGIKEVDKRYSIITANVPTEFITDEYHIRGRHYEISYYGSYDTKDFKNCVFNYLKVVEANPNDAKTYWRLGNLYEARYISENMAEEYLDLMFEYFQKSYEIDPDFAEANMGMGWSHFYNKENDQAYQFMKRAYELDPDNAEINFLFGAFFRSIGLYKKALDYYTRAMQLDPWPVEFVLSHEVLADCYSKLGRFVMLERYEEAEVQIDEALKYDPNSSSARRYRALIFAVQGNTKKALELIQDEDKAFRYPITSIYSLLGMKEKAIKNIELGIEISFESSGSYFYSYPVLVNNPCYNNLRDELHFQEILRVEKIKHEEKVRKYGDL
jgi:serine/threonine protein kinase/Tfp pilus assembly protein PilF